MPPEVPRNFIGTLGLGGLPGRGPENTRPADQNLQGQIAAFERALVVRPYMVWQK